MMSNVVSQVSLETSTISGFGTGIALIGGEFAVDGSGGANDNRVVDITSTDLVLDAVATPCVSTPDVGELATSNLADVDTMSSATPGKRISGVNHTSVVNAFWAVATIIVLPVDFCHARRGDVGTGCREYTALGRTWSTTG